jgi:pimeloyl-ACP methyl ester carboxylesterase
MRVPGHGDPTRRKPLPFMIADISRMVIDLLGSAGELTLNRIGGPVVSRWAPVVKQPRPVLTIPGFMTSDESLARLNSFLNHQGFKCRSWGLGPNRGPHKVSWGAYLSQVRRHLTAQVRALADECSAPVSIVAHSLGGVYARELAQHLEDEIDRVIMLGTPTLHPYRRNRHNQVPHLVSGWVNRQNFTELAGRAALLHWDAHRPRVPCVAIHSPIDGFVREDACCIPGYIVAQSSRRAPRENIRVLATHVGMTFSVWVLLAVADRLAVDRRNWRPFDPEFCLPAFLHPMARCAYPRADELWRDRGAAAYIRLSQ